VLNVVAHPDDDLLFLSPDLLASLASGSRVRTVYLTAGDDGRGPRYWRQRMRGVQAAYADMLGVGNAWSGVKAAEVGVDGTTALALRAAPQVSLVFVKLPDGGTGAGFGRYGHSSLPRLWTGRQSSIRAVDGSGRYTRAGLIAGITRLIQAFGADLVRTQDYLGRIGDGDHGDHHVTAYLTRAAAQAGPRAPRLSAYQDYATSGRPANVSGRSLTAKRSAFAVYSHYDTQICWPASCPPKADYTAWIRRQYLLAGG
jgi:LmbE family N-acetylglucosaminyl deacetylase